MREWPWAVITACVLFVSGCALAIIGAYELFGRGGALLVASLPCLFFSVMIMRGL